MINESNVPVALRPRDVVVLSQVLGAKFHETRIITASLEVFGALKAAGHDRSSFLEWSANNRPSIVRLESSIDATCRDLDRLLSDLRLEAGISKSKTSGWDYLYHYFLINGYIRSSLLGGHLASTLNREYGYVILLPDTPPDFHRDSICFRNQVINKLGGLSIKGVAYKEPGADRLASIYQNSYPIDLISDEIDSITSLPTCFSINEKSLGVLGKLSGNNLDFESPIFDVPFGPRRISLEGPLESYPEVNIYARLIELRALPWLARMVPILTPQTLKRFKERLVFQATFYLQLVRCEKLNNVTTLILSNHDGGISGPLLTWALNRSIRVTMIPHSDLDNVPRAFGNFEFTKGPVTNPCLDVQPIDGLLNLADASEGINRFRRVVPRAPVRIGNLVGTKLKILIIHNALDDYLYLPAVSLDDYAKAIRTFERNSDRFLVRHRWKPTSMARHLFLNERLDVDQENGVTNWAHVLVGIGQPSSYMYKAADLEKPTYQVIDDTLSPLGLALVPEGTRVINLKSLNDGAEYLVKMLQDAP